MDREQTMVASSRVLDQKQQNIFGRISLFWSVELQGHPAQLNGGDHDWLIQICCVTWLPKLNHFLLVTRYISGKTAIGNTYANNVYNTYESRRTTTTDKLKRFKRLSCAIVNKLEWPLVLLRTKPSCSKLNRWIRIEKQTASLSNTLPLEFVDFPWLY